MKKVYGFRGQYSIIYVYVSPPSLFVLHNPFSKCYSLLHSTRKENKVQPIFTIYIYNIYSVDCQTTKAATQPKWPVIVSHFPTNLWHRPALWSPKCAKWETFSTRRARPTRWGSALITLFSFSTSAYVHTKCVMPATIWWTTWKWHIKKLRLSTYLCLCENETVQVENQTYMNG